MKSSETTWERVKSSIDRQCGRHDWGYMDRQECNIGYMDVVYMNEWVKNTECIMGHNWDYMDKWEENVRFMEVNLSRDTGAETWRPCGCYYRVLIYPSGKGKATKWKEMIKCVHYGKLILTAVWNLARKPEVVRTLKRSRRNF